MLYSLYYNLYCLSYPSSCNDGQTLKSTERPLPPVRSAATVAMFDQGHIASPKQHRSPAAAQAPIPTTGHTSLPTYNRHMTPTPTSSLLK